MSGLADRLARYGVQSGALQHDPFVYRLIFVT